MRVLVILGIAIGLAFHTIPARPCSTFYIANDTRPVFGKNYDWKVDSGMLIVNKRGMEKQAMVGDNAARWTSKYGSVTFNQYGRELPSGGMNEAGLVVELMWLDATRYSESDSRPAMGNMQWIQYQLDNSRTVGDVVASDSEIRVAGSGTSKIHYLVADGDGECATIEFLGGKLVYHDKESMPVNVLTNHTYEESVVFLRQHDGFGGATPVRGDASSLGRFVNAAHLVGEFGGSDTSPVDYAFDVLTRVAQGSHTKWSIVYDIRGATVHFRTAAVRERRYVEFDDLDFTCASPVLILDLNAELSGNVREALSEYTQGANRRMIGEAFHKTSFLADVPISALNALAAYPNTTTCGHEPNAN